jgi:uncharacterized protein (DUF2235 family)
VPALKYKKREPILSKNILIFSDGTGQAGGLTPDQALSNVYKLYRASRVGPDSQIDPKQQIAFYDAGLGTDNDGGTIPLRSLKWFRKFWSSTTGTGISRNIADCYEAIVKHYEPGDRIYLFGFSRGAYTARCVGGVLGLCGIPTQGKDGVALPRYGKALRAIADEAVAKVYEHGSGKEDSDGVYKKERLEKARRFRAQYASGTELESNTVPYFIGVFDTVAALGASGRRWVLMFALLTAAIGAFAGTIAFILALMPWFTFLPSFAFVIAVILAIVAMGFWKTSYKSIDNYPPGKNSWHLVLKRLRFYDKSLNKRVQYARHAIAIDETRLDFDRVPWASANDAPTKVEGKPEWLKQWWFVGNHSDIGGSYPEDESRLSDIALQWMADEASSLPQPIILDRSKLNLFPDAGGMQHCEIKAMRDSYPNWWPAKLRQVWKERLREIKPEAMLHPSVLQRLSLNNVAAYGISGQYLPGNLSSHRDVVLANSNLSIKLENV